MFDCTALSLLLDWIDNMLTYALLFHWVSYSLPRYGTVLYTHQPDFGAGLDDAQVQDAGLDLDEDQDAFSFMQFSDGYA